MELRAELNEFPFRFRLLADNLATLERQVSMDLCQMDGRGIVSQEDADHFITVLSLTHREFARMQDEFESCRILNEQVLKKLGFDPPKPLDDWLEPKQK